MTCRSTLAALLLISLPLTACASDNTGTTGDTPTSDAAVETDSSLTADSTAPAVSSEPDTTMPGENEPADPSAATSWTLQTDPAWESAAEGVWFTGTGSDSFKDNVNVTTELLPTAMSVDEYIDAALKTVGEAAEFELLSRDTTAAADGTEIGMIVWTARLAGMPKLAFKQAIVVSDTAAYIATFTSEPDRIVEASAAVDPVLLTLRAA